jgi:membrane-associated phospholipid phosphatase
VLAERIDNPLASVGMYSIAALTAGQRLVTDQHWFSDDVMGALIGTLIGRAVVRRPILTKRESANRSWNILPIFAGNVQGVSIHTVF